MSFEMNWFVGSLVAADLGEFGFEVRLPRGIWRRLVCGIACGGRLKGFGTGVVVAKGLWREIKGRRWWQKACGGRLRGVWI